MESVLARSSEVLFVFLKDCPLFLRHTWLHSSGLMVALINEEVKLISLHKHMFLCVPAHVRILL